MVESAPSPTGRSPHRVRTPQAYDCGDCSDFAAIAEDLVRKRGEEPDAPTKILEAPWLAIKLRSPRSTRVKATASKQIWPLNNY